MPAPRTALARESHRRCVGSGFIVNRHGRPEVWLDLSRLPWRAWHGRLTGIDRVELAYGRHLLDLCAERLRFTAFDYRSGFRELPRAASETFLRALQDGWSEDRPDIRRMARSLFLAGVAPFAPALPTPLQPRPIWLNGARAGWIWPSWVCLPLRRRWGSIGRRSRWPASRKS